MAVYESLEGAVRLKFPKGWYLLEGRTPLGYRVMITPEPPNPARGFEPVVINMSKFTNASTSMELGHGSTEQRIDRHILQFLKISHGTLVKQRWITLQGMPARLVEVSATDPQGSRHHVLLVATLYQDILATLICEAPPDEFASYRATFTRIANSFEPFVTFTETPSSSPSTP